MSSLRPERRRTKTLLAMVMDGTLRPTLADVVGTAPHKATYQLVEQIIADCCQLEQSARPTAAQVSDRLGKGMATTPDALQR